MVFKTAKFSMKILSFNDHLPYISNWCLQGMEDSPNIVKITAKFRTHHGYCGAWSWSWANPPDTSSSARFYSTRPQSAAWENIEPLSGKQEQMASSPPPPLPGPGGHLGNYLSTRALAAATSDRHTGQTTQQSLWVKYFRNFKQILQSSVKESYVIFI